MRDIVIAVAMTALVASIWTKVGVDAYQHRSDFADARPLTRDDIQCDERTHTVTVKVKVKARVYSDSAFLEHALNLCGWLTFSVTPRDDAENCIAHNYEPVDCKELK